MANRRIEIYIWRCKGCGEGGEMDFKEFDLFGYFHHCPLVKGPFDIVPKIEIKEKDESTSST